MIFRTLGLPPSAKNWVMLSNSQKLCGRASKCASDKICDSPLKFRNVCSGLVRYMIFPRPYEGAYSLDRPYFPPMSNLSACQFLRLSPLLPFEGSSTIKAESSAVTAGLHLQDFPPIGANPARCAILRRFSAVCY